jgi:hypothetical protein
MNAKSLHAVAGPLSLFFASLFLVQVAAQEAWKPADGPLMTRWAKEVHPERVLPEYPRPLMVRKEWLNLNGLWDYAITSTNSARPLQFEGKILVPFPIESALSGVMRPVGESNTLWYRRTFEIPERWKGKQVLLHFGAVDWEATAWVNGRQVGTHRGGYDAFVFDIAGALGPSGLQELVVAVFDPTDTGTQPRGKQVRRPESIWYTSVTGIWQTPWLEPVSSSYFQEIPRITPDIDAGAVDVGFVARTAAPIEVKIQVRDGDRLVSEAIERGAGQNALFDSTSRLNIPTPKLWSPESPFLYGLHLTISQEGRVVDEIESYFGMRKISLGKDEKGVLRLCLNNKPLFQYGPLDQGWWPDGLYTAPTDEALKYDIEAMKKLGMNMARKHAKVEPARWYYWCDKLGLLVWQDMPSGDRYIGPRDPDIRRTRGSAEQFERELRRMIEGFYSHPSIVMWVPFNEGWGQYDTARIAQKVEEWDKSRLVNSASGWTDRGVGDVHDIHRYPGPDSPKPEASRAAVLGEFGGLGLPVRGHTWQAEKNWGYRSFTNAQALTDAYVALLDKLHPLVGEPGLSAAVYTQITDVEIEVNGLLTYDRALLKMDADRITAAHAKLFTPPPPPPTVKTLLPTSQAEGAEWKFTTQPPAEGWFEPDFDDSSWKTGQGGFGTRGTPGAIVRTPWNTSDIWLRRKFDLPRNGELENPHFVLHHDEDVAVYINGEPALKLSGWTTQYEQNPIGREARRLLQPGRNTIAIHCRQTSGGQYIDLGLIDLQANRN